MTAFAYYRKGVSNLISNKERHREQLRSQAGDPQDVRNRWAWSEKLVNTRLRCYVERENGLMGRILHEIKLQ